MKVKHLRNQLYDLNSTLPLMIRANVVLSKGLPACIEKSFPISEIRYDSELKAHVLWRGDEDLYENCTVWDVLMYLKKVLPDGDVILGRHSDRDGDIFNDIGKIFSTCNRTFIKVGKRLCK